MDDTTSEATNPCSTLEMASTSMHNPSNHTQWHFQQQMNEGMALTQANQYQFRGEAFEAWHQPRLGGRRPKLSEAQRKERKRQRDVNYRQKKKAEIEGLSAENRNLKEENGRLTKRLEEHIIRGPQGKGQLPAQVQRQDSYVSHSTSQVDQPRVHVQEHHGMEPNNEEADYSVDWINLDNDKAAAGIDGLEMDDLLGLLPSGDEMIPNERVAINEPAPEHEECSHSGLCHVEMKDHHGSNSGAADRLSSLEGNDLDLQNQKVPITAFATNRPIAQLFMQKIEADDASNVCFSDFTGLDGEYVNVGKYSFPLSLQPVVERIIAVYGDVSATSKMNLFIAEATYILFCASVKEMGDLQLEQVTEDRILKWRDAIKDALRINFKVDFAMEHLKKIARAYVSRIESQELESMGERISKLEADLNARREELAKRKEQCKKYVDAAKEFNGKSLSLFP